MKELKLPPLLQEQNKQNEENNLELFINNASTIKRH